jgi:hypothetical protein
VDAKIRKFMRNITYVTIDFHVFKDDYGLPNEGVNPHRIRNKQVHEVELKEVFGPIWGRSGYFLLILIMLKWWIKSRKSIQLSMIK